jgi:hypothetical protein
VKHRRRHGRSAFTSDVPAAERGKLRRFTNRECATSLPLRASVSRRHGGWKALRGRDGVRRRAPYAVWRARAGKPVAEGSVSRPRDGTLRHRQPVAFVEEFRADTRPALARSLRRGDARCTAPPSSPSRHLSFPSSHAATAPSVKASKQVKTAATPGQLSRVRSGSSTAKGARLPASSAQDRPATATSPTTRARAHRGAGTAPSTT